MATVVVFHAHPDDEALLTGGTLARLVAEGHRVVLVVACDGLVMGAARPDGGTERLDELRASGRVLGASRVLHLGYADSGHGAELYPDPPGRMRFVRAPIEEAAERLVVILREERAEILVGYDPNGGYRHRDHIRVHEVAERAALACHASQTSGTGRSARLFRLMVRLPIPVFGRFFGREYYVEIGPARAWLD